MSHIRNCIAFTLLEIAIVLTIIGVLIGGALAILPAAINASQYNETVRRMDYIHDVIQMYAIAFNRIPCPGGLSVKPDDAKYGKEADTDGTTCLLSSGTPGSWSTIGYENDSLSVPSGSTVRYGDGTSWNTKVESGSFSCGNGEFGDPIPGTYKHCELGASLSGNTVDFASGAITEGALPVRTLGIPDKYMYDAWGRRFRYAVNSLYTVASPVAGGTGSAMCGAKQPLTVNDASGTARTNAAAYVLMSHGKSGHGGYSHNGTTFSSGSTNADELKNCHCDSSAIPATYDGLYTAKLPTANNASSTDNYDDIVTYRELSQLKSPDVASTQCLIIKSDYVPGQDASAFVDSLQIIPSTGFSNPGFENPMLNNTDFQYNPTSAAWNFINGTGVANNNSGFTNGNSDAPDGAQVAFLQGSTGTVSQTITTAAGKYTLQFYASNRMNSGGNPEDFNVLVDGSVVAHFTVNAGTYSQLVTPQFTLAAGSHIISFAVLNTGAYSDVAAFIDDVALVDSTTDTTALTGLNSALDGGFETPQIASGTFSAPTTSTWHFYGSAVIVANGSPYGNPNAPAGTQQAVIQNSGTISHAIALKPGNYQIKFLTLNRQFGDQQTLNVYIDDKQVGTVTPLHVNTTYYNQYITDPFVIP